MTTTNRLEQAAAWHGVWTALITPLKVQGGELALDVGSLEALIERQINEGIHGLVIAGSTGEGSLLTPPNYVALLREARRIAGSRIPLVVGLGIGGTASCLANLALAREHHYDGVLASPPAYVKAPQRGLVDHFLRLGQEGLPVCVYEVASRAASSIDVATLDAIANAKHPGARAIIATKDASAKMERALETTRRLGDRVALLSGDDFTVAPFVNCGGTGVISVVSHLTPKSLAAVLTHARAGRVAAAVREQNRLIPLIEALFWEANPIPVKQLAHALGYIKEAAFSAPLVNMDQGLLAKLIELARATPDRPQA